MKAVLNAVLEAKIGSFRNDFLDNARNFFFEDGATFHNTEFGSHREKLVRRFLRSFVPHRLEISHGFVVNSENDIATQADVVIFDSAHSPLIETDNDQLFFGAEAVCAIGEVKSTRTTSSLASALRKLAAQKRIKHQAWAGPATRVGSISSDKQLITFLICEEIRDYDGTLSSPDEINRAFLAAYSEPGCPIPAELRHNLVLSIKQGLGVYAQEGANPTLRALPYSGAANQFMWVTPTDPNANDHIALFCALLFELTQSAQTFSIPLLKYMAKPQISCTHGTQLNVMETEEEGTYSISQRQFEFKVSQDVTVLGLKSE